MKTLVASMAILLLLGTGCTQYTPSDNATGTAKEPLSVGAILPLSGPAAIWGEEMKNGMELAKKELEMQEIDIDITYEDSAASATGGIAAFNSLTSVHDVDAVVSIFSRVSIPLTPLAETKKTPLLASVVAAESFAKDSPYNFRFFSRPEDYVIPHFNGPLTKKSFPTIGVLYIEDEFGESVREAIEKEAAKSGILITLQESFLPNSTDFRTSLTKIEAARPDALLVVAAVPPEFINIVKQKNELGLDMPLFEASSQLSVPTNHNALGDLIEGTYGIAYPFTLNLSGEEFRETYTQTFGKKPFFASALAYDMIMTLATATDGQSLLGPEIVANLHDLGTIKTLNGSINIEGNGEINPKTYSFVIQDGEITNLE